MNALTTIINQDTTNLDALIERTSLELLEASRSFEAMFLARLHEALQLGCKASAFINAVRVDFNSRARALNVSGKTISNRLSDALCVAEHNANLLENCTSLQRTADKIRKDRKTAKQPAIETEKDARDKIAKAMSVIRANVAYAGYDEAQLIQLLMATFGASVEVANGATTTKLTVTTV